MAHKSHAPLSYAKDNRMKCKSNQNKKKEQD